MSVTIINDDCIAAMRRLPEKSVQCCVTSPPYFGLRVYGAGEREIGREPTPAEFIAKMIEVFSEVKRVLRDDGTLWLNLGDSYARTGGSDKKNAPTAQCGATRSIIGSAGDRKQRAPDGFKQKDMLLIPHRVALALQSDGWYLRAACPWIKRNGMPDSTQDRPTQCIETMFMLTKSKRCYYDAEAVKKVAKTGANGSRFDTGKTVGPHTGTVSTKPRIEDGKRLRRTSDWFFESWQGLLLDGDDEPSAFVVNLKGYKEAHFATFPAALVEPCILASTSEQGCCSSCGAPRIRQCVKTPMVIDRSERTHDLGRTRSSGTMVSPASSETTGWEASCGCVTPSSPCVVLDPFGGSGTTGEVATKHGRNAILIELNPAYVTLAEKRCGLTDWTL